MPCHQKLDMILENTKKCAPKLLHLIEKKILKRHLKIDFESQFLELF